MHAREVRATLCRMRVSGMLLLGHDHSHQGNICICRSPVNPYTNVFPLVIVLAVSLLKEALEDHKRHTKDVEVQHLDASSHR